jgi:hypothetical protein
MAKDPQGRKDKRSIVVPERWWGGEILAIPVGASGIPMTLGVTKARAIIKYIKDIEKFVEDVEDDRRANKTINTQKHTG